MKQLAQILHQLKKSTSGFTLIELLVVIGILGILAAALVATIDPFEQLKKAQDTTVKNTAVEFVDSILRYYTTHNALMWNVDTTCATEVAGNGAATTMTGFTVSGTGPNLYQMGSSVVAAGVTSGCLADLVNDGELKAAFTSQTGVLSSILVSGTTNAATACFAPQSKSQKNDINAKYIITSGTFTVNTSAGSATNGCTDGLSGTATCYWCAQ